jgi:hypothetical protein
MDEDLNVGNLLETRAERAPTTQTSHPMLLITAHKGRQSSPITVLAIGAVMVALGIILISAKSGRRVHVMERY